MNRLSVHYRANHAAAAVNEMFFLGLDFRQG